MTGPEREQWPGPTRATAALSNHQAPDKDQGKTTGPARIDHSLRIVLAQLALASWATLYALMGWPVLPLKPREKVPATKHGLVDASTDLDEITAWWTDNPDFNIGVATGHVFDVLDLDGPEGEQAFDSWWLANVPDQSPNLSSMLLAGTPGGGQHWFVAPPGGKNRAGMLPHVDWRGAGGYVVVAPSIHPNGGRYEWLNDPATAQFFPAPPQLLELARGEERRTESRFEPRAPRAGDGSRYGLAALRRACEQISASSEGVRNHTLNSQALGIYRLVAGGELGQGITDECLYAAGLDCGLPEAEVRATLESARKAGLLQPRRAS